MNCGHEKQLIDFFDECAHRGTMDGFTPEELQKLNGLMHRWNLRPGDRVLEPGCGSGRLSFKLAEKIGPNGEVVACDVSKKMISRALNKSNHQQIVFMQTCVTAIPCPKRYFDHVICLNVFPHFFEPLKVLRQFADLLKTNGQLWINHFQGRHQINRFHEQVGGAVQDHRIPDKTTMLDLIQRSGFQLVEYEDSQDLYSLHAVLED